MAALALPVVSPRLRNILLATDFSHSSGAALIGARAIARSCGSTLHVVHVVSGRPATAGGYSPTPQHAEEEMKHFLSQHSLRGFAHRTWIEQGAVAEVVQGLVRRENIDLVALGTHRGHQLAKPVLGSTARQIFGAATCPVMTVAESAEIRQPEAASLECILYATDFSEGSLRALPYALSLALANRSQLMLLYVDCKEITREWIEEARIEERLLDLLPAGTQQFCRLEPIVEIGSAEERIVGIAEEHNAHLIVLGSRSETSLAPGVPPGRTAVSVVEQAHCPVLTVRV